MLSDFVKTAGVNPPLVKMEKMFSHAQKISRPIILIFSLQIADL